MIIFSSDGCCERDKFVQQTRWLRYCLLLNSELGFLKDLQFVSLWPKVLIWDILHTIFVLFVRAL